MTHTFVVSLVGSLFVLFFCKHFFLPGLILFFSNTISSASTFLPIKYHYHNYKFTNVSSFSAYDNYHALLVGLLIIVVGFLEYAKANCENDNKETRINPAHYLQQTSYALLLYFSIFACLLNGIAVAMKVSLIQGAFDRFINVTSSLGSIPAYGAVIIAGVAYANSGRKLRTVSLTLVVLLLVILKDFVFGKRGLSVNAILLCTYSFYFFGYANGSNQKWKIIKGVAVAFVVLTALSFLIECFKNYTNIENLALPAINIFGKISLQHYASNYIYTHLAGSSPVMPLLTFWVHLPIIDVTKYYSYLYYPILDWMPWNSATFLGLCIEDFGRLGGGFYYLLAHIVGLLCFIPSPYKNYLIPDGLSIAFLTSLTLAPIGATLPFNPRHLLVVILIGFLCWISSKYVQRNAVV